MKRILIIGAGGHSNVVEDTLIEQGIFKEIVFLDDNFNNNRTLLSETKNIMGSSRLIYNKKLRMLSTNFCNGGNEIYKIEN